MSINWDYEIKTFQLSNGGSYKPDFYLIDTHEFIEIKGSFYLLEECLPRIHLFQENTGYKITVVQEKDLRKLIKSTPFLFSQLTTEWKKIATSFGIDTTGKNNPRYGVTFSQETKDKIATKAKARMQDSVYKSKWLKAQANSEKVKANTIRLGQARKSVKLKPYDVICSYCQKVFNIQHRWQLRNKQRYCSTDCACKASFKKRNEEVSSLIKNIAFEYAIKQREEIVRAKMNKIKPILSDFYNIVFNLTGIKDVRTICQVLLGSNSNRKELIYYFRSLVENVLETSANNEALELEDKEPLG